MSEYLTIVHGVVQNNTLLEFTCTTNNYLKFL